MKNHTTTAVACLLSLLSAAPPAQAAKPVTYPGGWTVMQMNDRDANGLHILRTVTPQYSVGYMGEYRRDEGYWFNGAEVNYLARRWNLPASQANIFLTAGAGVATSDRAPFDHATRPGAYAGVLADWEDRRYFVSYENRAFTAGDIDSYVTHKARVGVAPYEGDYGDLHTWLMLETAYTPGQGPVTFTPLVRLFKGDVMAEAGVSTEGKALFNLIVNF